MEQPDFDPDEDARICDECGDNAVDTFETRAGQFVCALCVVTRQSEAAEKYLAASRDEEEPA